MRGVGIVKNDKFATIDLPHFSKFNVWYVKYTHMMVEFRLFVQTEPWISNFQEGKGLKSTNQYRLRGNLTMVVYMHLERNTCGWFLSF